MSSWPAGMRVPYVDVARGLSILLVALHHSMFQTLVPELMRPLGLFRLPLFFFLSGVLFKVGTPWFAVLEDKTATLLKPYFFVLSLLLLRSVLKGQEDGLARLGGMLHGTGATIEWIPMWFLPHLWLVFLSCALLLKALRLAAYPRLIQGLAVLALLTLGTRHVDFAWPLEVQVLEHAFVLHGLPFSADLLPISAAYFLLGSLLREQVLRLRPARPAMLLAVLVFVVVATTTDAHVDLNYRLYQSPFFATLGALGGIGAVLWLTHGLGPDSAAARALALLGRSSLFILIFHDYVDNKTYAALASVTPAGHEGLLALLAFAACLIVPLGIRQLAQRSRVLSYAFALKPVRRGLES